MALHADMRDAEGFCLRRFAITLSVLLAALGGWQFVILLCGNDNVSGVRLSWPRVAEACMQMVVWLTSAMLLGLEATKGVHTSVYVRLSWVVVWIGTLVKGYDIVVPNIA